MRKDQDRARDDAAQHSRRTAKVVRNQGNFTVARHKRMDEPEHCGERQACHKSAEVGRTREALQSGGGALIKPALKFDHQPVLACALKLWTIRNLTKGRDAVGFSPKSDLTRFGKGPVLDLKGGLSIKRDFEAASGKVHA